MVLGPLKLPGLFLWLLDRPIKDGAGSGLYVSFRRLEPALEVGVVMSVEENGSLGNPREGCRGGLGILGLRLLPASPEGCPRAQMLTSRPWGYTPAAPTPHRDANAPRWCGRGRVGRVSPEK